MRTLDVLAARVRSKIDTTNECWIWTGAKNALGYGRIAIGQNRQAKAHRFVYEALVGPIPDGLELDHLCVTPSCVNPAHLEPVTHAENMRRYGARKTLCKRGHTRTPENIAIYRKPNGRLSRVCLKCRPIIWRSWADRKASAA